MYLRTVTALNSMNESGDGRISRSEQSGKEKNNDGADENPSPVIYAPFLFAFGFNHFTENLRYGEISDFQSIVRIRICCECSQRRSLSVEICARNKQWEIWKIAGGCWKPLERVGF